MGNSLSLHPGLAEFQSGLLRQEGLPKLNAEEKVLAISGASEDGRLQERNRSRQLRLVGERDGNLQRDFASGIHVTTGCQQYATRREIQRGGKFEEFLAIRGFSANEE